MRARAARWWCAGLLALALVSGARALTMIHSGTVVGTVAVAVDTTAAHTFVKVWNNCSVTAYVGWSSGITASNGIPVPTGQWVEFSTEVVAGNRLFGVVASGTCDLRTLELRQ